MFKSIVLKTKFTERKRMARRKEDFRNKCLVVGKKRIIDVKFTGHSCDAFFVTVETV
jgi:hypothetical protein